MDVDLFLMTLNIFFVSDFFGRYQPFASEMALNFNGGRSLFVIRQYPKHEMQSVSAHKYVHIEWK